MLAVLNLSADPVDVTCTGPLHAGRYTDALGTDVVQVEPTTRMTLPGWGYRVLIGESGTGVRPSRQ